ncbi:hypothetical protein GPM19_07405 [Halomonas sp. ZH2S]|uniref:Uncharacterized protein n=1 Tax=Vreelandella zhuhanensis TaxID=2684210 RepID=A0A7X3H0P4_9GAMM|nr:hypothetical protein [Halomonas zhuhanensis]MWJ28029.1 hypothetical protein [Halomonas zhuhanensis]
MGATPDRATVLESFATTVVPLALPTLPAASERGSYSMNPRYEGGSVIQENNHSGHQQAVIARQVRRRAPGATGIVDACLGEAA